MHRRARLLSLTWPHVLCNPPELPYSCCNRCSISPLTHTLVHALPCARVQGLLGQNHTAKTHLQTECHCKRLMILTVFMFFLQEDEEGIWAWWPSWWRSCQIPVSVFGAVLHPVAILSTCKQHLTDRTECNGTRLHVLFSRNPHTPSSNISSFKLLCAFQMYNIVYRVHAVGHSVVLDYTLIRRWW